MPVFGRPCGITEQASTLSILTWNVAGWRSTHANIVARFGSLEAYLARLKVDVLCIQEVKLLAQDVALDKTGFGARSDRLDAFFSLSKTRAENGVAVFARKGLVRSADPTLDYAETADAGRFIEADFGAFVLFNVYVPCVGMGHPAGVASKMEFLLHLRRRMRAVRAVKPVVLVGDLNLKMRLNDVEPGRHRVSISGLAASVPRAGESGLVTNLRAALVEPGAWERLRAVLESVYAKQAKKRFHYWIGDTKLDTIESSEDGSLHDFRTQGVVAARRAASANAPEVDASLSGGFDAEGRWVLREDGTLQVEVLAAVAPHAFPRHVPVQPSSADIAAFADCDGVDWLSSDAPCLIAWARSLIDQDGMLEVVSQLFPRARGRFTVWSQYTNQRYTNRGTRVDYIFLDRAFFESRLVLPTLPLDGCLCVGAHPSDGSCAWDEASALRAATAYGRWRQASFEGGGIPPPTGPEAWREQFKRAGQPGIVYTPPAFSDHVGVVALVRLERSDIDGAGVVVASDRATLSTRPHATQRKIDAFFTKRSPSSASSASAESDSKRTKSGADSSSGRTAVARTTATPASSTSP